MDTKLFVSTVCQYEHTYIMQPLQLLFRSNAV